MEKEIEKEVEESDKDKPMEEEGFSKTPILKLEKNTEELNLEVDKDEESKSIKTVNDNNTVQTDDNDELTDDIRDVGISFNDVDKVLDMGTNIEENIDAPKTIERLEQISEINNQRRKEEEEDDDDEDNLEIFDDNNISLDISDVHDLSKELRVEAPPLLNDIEVLD